MSILEKNKRRFFSSLLTTVIALIFMFYAHSASAAVYSQNVVPGSGGIATSDNEIGVTHSAAKAFDGSLSTWWRPANYDPCQLIYEFPTARVITKFSVLNNDIQHGTIPLEFNFEGYNELTSQWDVLQHVSTTEFLMYEGILDNQTAYEKYRLNIFSWDTEWAVGIYEIQMFETVANDLLPQLLNSRGIYTQELNFGNAKQISNIKFSLNNIDDACTLPVTSNFEGYNEETGEWVVLSSSSLLSFGDNEMLVNSSEKYKKYRLNLYFDESSTVSLNVTEILGY